MEQLKTKEALPQIQPLNLTVDHIIARGQCGTDHLGNLQLLCGNCNRVNRGMEYLMTRLQGA